MSQESTPPRAPIPAYLPNALTVLRLVLVPVFLVLLFVAPSDLGWRLGATVAFGVAILTDFFDGRLARKHNLVSNFGKIWDSIADKALTGMGFIGLSILGELPWWITVIILLREWGITVLRFWVLKYGTVMAANKGGKLKTVTQAVGLALFIPGLQYLPFWWGWVAWVVMIVAFALTVWTGLDYVLAAKKTRDAYHAAHPEEKK